MIIESWSLIRSRRLLKTDRFPDRLGDHSTEDVPYTRTSPALRMALCLAQHAKICQVTESSCQLLFYAPTTFAAKGFQWEKADMEAQKGRINKRNAQKHNQQILARVPSWSTSISLGLAKSFA